MLKRSWPLLTLAFVLATRPAPLRAQDVSYRVVVHVTNPVTRLTREQTSQIFCVSDAVDNRKPVLPVDQPADSPVRRASRSRCTGADRVGADLLAATDVRGAGVAPRNGHPTPRCSLHPAVPQRHRLRDRDATLGSDVTVVIVTP